MELLDKVLGALTNLTWVSSTQAYRLPGPPNTYTSAETLVSRGRLCSLADREKTQKALDAEVERACRDRMLDTMHCMMELFDDWENSRPA